MPSIVRWLLAALSCYRLAQLVALDDGPGDVLLHLRERAGAYQYGSDGRPARSIGRLVACPFCLGMWAALPCAALALWPSAVGDAILAVFGIAGAQAAIQGERNANSKNSG